MRTWALMLVSAGVMLVVSPSRAEIVSISGTVSAEIAETRAGASSESAATDSASDSYPDATDVLPLQVAATLDRPDQDAAGVVAVQFADPQTATGQNPEEFAINVALNSLDDTVYYTAGGVAQEMREIRISAAEIPGTLPGQELSLAGRFFVDAALVVFAPVETVDLTGAQVTLRLRVEQKSSGSEPVEVFSGSLTVNGGEDQALEVVPDGLFPTDALTSADLSDLDAELGVFQVYVLPSTPIAYAYDVVIDEPTTLIASVEVDVTNAPGGVGVAGVVGTPLDSLNEVITLTRDEQSASKMTNAVRTERSDPSGDLVFAPPMPWFVPAGCGLFGLESLLVITGLVGWRLVGPRGLHR